MLRGRAGAPALVPPADPVGLTPLINVGDAVPLVRNALRSRLNRRGEPLWDISMDVTTISAGSFDVVSSWQQFCDDVTALGRLIVVTEYNPCPMSPATQFVRAPQKQRNHTWGFHVVQCQYKAWMSVTVPTAFYMYVRPDMHWFVPLRRFIVDLWKYIPLRDAWVPDCENAWGVNDRFAILNTKAASAYFTRYTHFIDPPRPRMKTENILKYALESRNISVGTVPTVGALTCCRFIARCFRKRCRMVRFGNVTVGVKYPFEAQAAVQNAEQFSFGVRSHRRKIVLTRPPQIDWMAWKRNSTDVQMRNALANPVLPGATIWGDCSFVVYTVVSAPQRVAPPPKGFDRGCALLFAYGDSVVNVTSWTRLQAEPFTPKSDLKLHGRALSRVLKLKSHLLGADKPLVYVDSKRTVRNAAGMARVLHEMERCNASMFTYMHPKRPHSLLGEFDAIRRLRRTSNFTALQEQRDFVLHDAGLYTSDRAGKTFVNDGSLIFRRAGSDTRRFEEAWWRTYIHGSDRDQPAFAIAYHTMYNTTTPACGQRLWMVAYDGNQSAGMPFSHSDFLGGWRP